MVDRLNRLMALDSLRFSVVLRPIAGQFLAPAT